MTAVGSGAGTESGARVGLRAAAAAPFLGLRLVLGAPAVRRPFLRGLAVSLVATVLVFGGALWGGFALVDRLVGADADPGLLWQIVAVVAKIAAVALLLVASPVLFTILLGIVGGPFLTAVHVAARAHAGGAPYPELGARAEAALTARGIGWELRRLLRFLVATVACALLALIPLVGLVAPVLLALLSAHTLAWELLTPHFEARGFDWAAQKAFLRRRRGLALGLGGAAALLLLVPFAQPLVAFGNQAGAGALSARVDPT